MPAEPVTTAALFALALGLVEIIKQLVGKIAAKKEDGDTPSIKSIDKKVDRCAEALVQVAGALERQADTLDRLERRLEVATDAVIETKLTVVNGAKH